MEIDDKISVIKERQNDGMCPFKKNSVELNTKLDFTTGLKVNVPDRLLKRTPGIFRS